MHISGFSIAISYCHWVYPTVPKKDNEEDLEELLNILFAVARGNDPDAEIEKLSICS